MLGIVRRGLRRPVGPGSVRGRTLMAALVIATLLAGASVAQAMEVSVSGNTLILSGPVVGDELAKTRNMFAQNPAINLAVLRNSWGGRADRLSDWRALSGQGYDHRGFRLLRLVVLPHVPGRPAARVYG